MASRLLPAFRRTIGVFSSNYQAYKLGGFPKHSRKSLRKGSASFFALAAAAAAGSLWLERYDETSITLSPQLHHLLMRFWQQGLESNHQSALLTDVSGSVDCFRTSNTDASDTSSLSSNHFQTEFQNGAGTTPKSDSTCLTRHSIADAAAKVAPAVVNLTVTQGIRGMFLGRSIGSGTIIDSNGTILTNAHVVTEFTNAGVPYKGKVVVTLQDGRTFDGEVINADFHTDIAVVRINTKDPLPAAKLGSSSKLRPGDWVIALGCPLSLQNTVTAGIVSYVDRKSSDLGLGGIRREYYYLQTDCAINEGSSGGPLVNLDGEVIGINTMKALAADGVSFAIPIDSVIKTVEHFKKHGRVVRPWLGLKMLDLNELIIAQLKERDPAFPDVTESVLVPQVTPGSPAQRAGFRPGDVVIQFDGKPTKSIKEITEIMGDKVVVAFKVMESLEHAVKRGDPIIAEYLGGAVTCDAYHMTNPRSDGLGVSTCIRKCLEDAGVSPEEVNYINAHATSTRAGDLAEVNAINNVFKDTSSIKMNGTKSMIGHCIGAAGAMEAIATIKAITTGWLHPTINQFNTEPNVTIDTVPNVKKQHEVHVGISNSFGFGGHNSVIAFAPFNP